MLHRNFQLAIPLNGAKLSASPSFVSLRTRSMNGYPPMEIREITHSSHDCWIVWLHARNAASLYGLGIAVHPMKSFGGRAA